MESPSTCTVTAHRRVIMPTLTAMLVVEVIAFFFFLVGYVAMELTALQALGLAIATFWVALLIFSLLLLVVANDDSLPIKLAVGALIASSLAVVMITPWWISSVLVVPPALEGMIPTVKIGGVVFAFACIGCATALLGNADRDLGHPKRNQEYYFFFLCHLLLGSMTALSDKFPTGAVIVLAVVLVLIQICLYIYVSFFRAMVAAEHLQPLPTDPAPATPPTDGETATASSAAPAGDAPAGADGPKSADVLPLTRDAA